MNSLLLVDQKYITSVLLIQLLTPLTIAVQVTETFWYISGNILKWIKTYLKGRTFSVRINNVNGKVCLLTYGVPQRTTVPGPLLFIMYIHDLILWQLYLPSNIVKHPAFFLFVQPKVQTLKYALYSKISCLPLAHMHLTKHDL